MSKLPANWSEEDEMEKREMMTFMSGEEGLEVFCRELREKGVTLPKNDIWRHAKRANIEQAVHATFSLLGGVPGFALWAHKNPSLFYPAYMKLVPLDPANAGGANIQINLAVPESPLDAIEIDSFGKIKE